MKLQAGHRDTDSDGFEAWGDSPAPPPHAPPTAARDPTHTETPTKNPPRAAAAKPLVLRRTTSSVHSTPRRTVSPMRRQTQPERSDDDGLRMPSMRQVLSVVVVVATIAAALLAFGSNATGGGDTPRTDAGPRGDTPRPGAAAEAGACPRSCAFLLQGYRLPMAVRSQFQARSNCSHLVVTPKVPPTRTVTAVVTNSADPAKVPALPRFCGGVLLVHGPDTDAAAVQAFSAALQRRDLVVAAVAEGAPDADVVSALLRVNGRKGTAGHKQDARGGSSPAVTATAAPPTGRAVSVGGTNSSAPAAFDGDKKTKAPAPAEDDDAPAKKKTKAPAPAEDDDAPAKKKTKAPAPAEDDDAPAKKKTKAPAPAEDDDAPAKKKTKAPAPAEDDDAPAKKKTKAPAPAEDDDAPAKKKTKAPAPAEDDDAPAKKKTKAPAPAEDDDAPAKKKTKAPAPAEDDDAPAKKKTKAPAPAEDDDAPAKKKTKAPAPAEDDDAPAKKKTKAPAPAEDDDAPAKKKTKAPAPAEDDDAPAKKKTKAPAPAEDDDAPAKKKTKAPAPAEDDGSEDSSDAASTSRKALGAQSGPRRRQLNTSGVRDAKVPAGPRYQRPVLDPFASNAADTQYYAPAPRSRIRCTSLVANSSTTLLLGTQVPSAHVCLLENVCVGWQHLYFFDPNPSGLNETASRQGAMETARFPHTALLQQNFTNIVTSPAMAARLWRNGTTLAPNTSAVLWHAYCCHHPVHFMEPLGMLHAGLDRCGRPDAPLDAVSAAICADPPREAYLTLGSGLSPFARLMLEAALRTPNASAHTAQTQCFRRAVVPSSGYAVWPSRSAAAAFRTTLHGMAAPKEGNVKGSGNETGLTRLIVVAERRGRRRVSDPEALAAAVGAFARNHSAEVRTVRFSSMAVADIAALLRRADVLISPHGADLANMVFLPRGAAVVELNPFLFFEPRFHDMARALELRYTAWTCTARRCAFGNQSFGAFDALTADTPHSRYNETARTFTLAASNTTFVYPPVGYPGDCANCVRLLHTPKLHGALFGSLRDSDVHIGGHEAELTAALLNVTHPWRL